MLEHESKKKTFTNFFLQTLHLKLAIIFKTCVFLHISFSNVYYLKAIREKGRKLLNWSLVES